MTLKNRNIMVTGGAGFIGSTLVRRLLGAGANVVVFDNFFSGSMENLAEVADRITVVTGDIRDPALRMVMREQNIDKVFNLAAEPFIPWCYDRPQSFFEVNANGTLNVLLASKEAGVERVVQYSSSEVYGTAQTVPMDEGHPTLPLSTYAVSKLAADRLSFSLHKEQGIPVVILRQFNVYGPRETHPYIIPELISQLEKSNKLTLGNIEARRDFTYVEDAADGAIKLMETPGLEGEVINMGSGKDYSIREMAEIVAGLMGRGEPDISVDKKRLRPVDLERLCCNYSKMNTLTGWEPKKSFKNGLKETIRFFEEREKKWIWEGKTTPVPECWMKK